MKSFTGMISWLLLLAVLAVPSFLFYTWWAAKAGNETAAAAPAQNVSTAVIFGAAQDAAPAGAAAAPAVPAARDQAPAAEQRTMDPPTPAEPGAAQDLKPILEQTAVSTTTGEAARQPGTELSAAQVSTAAGTGSYFDPKSGRDPTLTPDDYQKIRDEEARRLEAEREQRTAQVKKAREAGGETRIKLQGIVGNSMIINGEMRSVGDTVNGVKLLKLGPNYVIGEYRGRKFKKILQ